MEPTPSPVVVEEGAEPAEDAANPYTVSTHVLVPEEDVRAVACAPSPPGLASPRVTTCARRSRIF